MTLPHGAVELSDPVEEMLKKTGCIEKHYKVQVRKLYLSLCKMYLGINYKVK